MNRTVRVRRIKALCGANKRRLLQVMEDLVEADIDGNSLIHQDIQKTIMDLGRIESLAKE